MGPVITTVLLRTAGEEADLKVCWLAFAWWLLLAMGSFALAQSSVEVMALQAERVDDEGLSPPSAI